MRMASSISRFLARFSAAQAGVAVVEFALILPIMLLVYIGTIEGSALITADRKVQSASGTVGDLVARIDTETTNANLLELVRAAGGIMRPYDPTQLIQVITQVRVVSGNATVIWSRGYENQASKPALARAVGSVYANMPTSITNIAEDKYVIVSEARYSYKPFSGIFFNQAVELDRENFYLPRFGDKITIK